MPPTNKIWDTYSALFRHTIIFFDFGNDGPVILLEESEKWHKLIKAGGDEDVGEKVDCSRLGFQLATWTWKWRLLRLMQNLRSVVFNIENFRCPSGCYPANGLEFVLDSYFISRGGFIKAIAPSFDDGTKESKVLIEIVGAVDDEDRELLRKISGVVVA